MKTIFPKIIIAAGITALVLAGCRKNEDISEKPTLRWESAEFTTDSLTNRTTLLLGIYFTDGDGDIGLLKPPDSSELCDDDVYNLLIRYFEKVEGVYEEIMPVDSCQPFHNLLPNLTPEGQNKTLEGTIFSNFSYFAFPRNADADSIRFEFKLRDRAGHESEWAISDPIATP